MAPQREWFEKDYYKVLGVLGDAPPRRTSPRRTASWRASTTPTPTRVTPGRGALQGDLRRLRRVGDEAKRKEYDEVRKLGPMGGVFGGGPAARAAARASRSPSTAATLGDLLGNLFGRGGRRRARRRGQRRRPAAGRRPRGRAARCRSSTRSTASPRRCHLTSDAACSHLPRHAAPRPGTTPHACAQSAAAGAWSTTTRACSRSASRAPTASGTGVVVDDPCPTCRGTGVERRPREVKVRIPPASTTASASG